MLCLIHAVLQQMAARLPGVPLPAVEQHAQLLFSLCARGSSLGARDKGPLMGLQPAQVLPCSSKFKVVGALMQGLWGS